MKTFVYLFFKNILAEVVVKCCKIVLFRYLKYMYTCFLILNKIELLLVPLIIMLM